MSVRLESLSLEVQVDAEAWTAFAPVRIGVVVVAGMAVLMTTAVMTVGVAVRFSDDAALDTA